MYLRALLLFTSFFVVSSCNISRLSKENPEKNKNKRLVLKLLVLYIDKLHALAVLTFPVEAGTV